MQMGASPWWQACMGDGGGLPELRTSAGQGGHPFLPLPLPQQAARWQGASPAAPRELLLAVQPQQLGEECASFVHRASRPGIWIVFAALWRTWKVFIPAALSPPPSPAF